jgi:hypothetical protein
MDPTPASTSLESELTDSAPTHTSLVQQAGSFKALLGGAISGGMGYLVWLLLRAILAKLPLLPSDAPFVARNLGLFVRYLLVGSLSLMAFMFGVIGIGLLAYAGQLLIQKLSKS